MKVLETYNKENINDLSINGKKVIDLMDNYFKKEPVEYSKNFYHNLFSLDILKVDEIYDEEALGSLGFYSENTNTVIYVKESCLVHELTHVSGYDSEEYLSSFDGIYHTKGITEGMTEYLARQIYPKKVACDYEFEVFTMTMLSQLEGVKKSYFLPNALEFLNIFPDKLALYNLLYCLDYYFESNEKILHSIDLESFNNAKMHKIKNCIRTVLSSIITIYLSKETDQDKIKQFKCQYMDLLNDQLLNSLLKEYDPKYLDYAYHNLYHTNIRIKRK